MIKIVGIDPGLAGTGVGVVAGDGRDVSGYAFGSISTCKDDPVHKRLEIIFDGVHDLLVREKPDLVVLEDIFSLGKYPGSGIVLGKVSGVLLLAASRAGAKIEEVAVREAKQVITGSGRADKHQMERSVRDILNHSGIIRPFHAADALALALTGFYRFGRQGV